MKDGDFCGLIALQSNYGTVGIKMEDGKKYLVMTTKDGEQERLAWNSNTAYFRVFFDYEDSRDIAEFFYSENGKDFVKTGIDLKMLYTLDHFMGYRIGIFYYASKTTGGHVDFKDFAYKRFS